MLAIINSRTSLANVACLWENTFLNIISTVWCSVPHSTQMSVHPPTYTLGYSTIHLIWHFCPNLLLGYMCLLLSATCVATYFENLSKRQIQSLFISFALWFESASELCTPWRDKQDDLIWLEPQFKVTAHLGPKLLSTMNSTRFLVSFNIGYFWSSKYIIILP